MPLDLCSILNQSKREVIEAQMSLKLPNWSTTELQWIGIHPIRFGTVTVHGHRSQLLQIVLVKVVAHDKSSWYAATAQHILHR